MRLKKILVFQGWMQFRPEKDDALKEALARTGFYVFLLPPVKTGGYNKITSMGLRKILVFQGWMQFRPRKG